VYSLFSDLEAMPSWSPWLNSGVVDEQDVTISTWKLAARGINVSWKAKNVVVEEGVVIQWESLTGLKNRGAVRFLDEGSEGKCRVTMKISFMIPDFAKKISSGIVSQKVDEALEADLKRFRARCLLDHRKEMKKMRL